MSLRRTSATALALLVAAHLYGCADGGPTEPLLPAGASVEVTPATKTLTALDDVCRFVAVARDEGGNTISGRTFIWSSSDEDVATVSAAGLAKAVGDGTATIIATTGGLADSASLTVSQVVAAVEVTPAECDVTGLGETCLFTALAKDANGHTIAGTSFEWLSSDEDVATVDSAGLATTVGSGEATITAEAGGEQGDAALTVVVFASLSAGSLHRCGVATDGDAFCWGFDYYGQLGDGMSGHQLTPVPVAGGLSFASVSAGDEHTCGVTIDGSAYCWGNNDNGQVGDGGPIWCCRGTPMPVFGGLSFASVSAAYRHTCGVATDGSAYCWGDNEYGQLGDGTTTDRPTPVAVSGGLSFASLDAGVLHTCGVATDGSAYCWGNNYKGKLGDGTTTGRLVPVPVSGGLSFASVSAAYRHTCGVATDGSAYCWGDNEYGQLGSGTWTDKLSPWPVSRGLSFASVSGARCHTCGVATDGSAYCWGRNQYGQLGDGTTRDRPNPGAVSGGLSFASVSGAHYYTCGVTSNGGTYCWGRVPEPHAP